MLNTQENALIVFARKPELGKVKTRLARTVGDEKALDIYHHLLKHTRLIARAAKATTFIFLTEEIKNEYWSEFVCELQTGETLGEKMQHAFQSVFLKGFKKCVIIGSDCPELTPEIVNDAFGALDQFDAVIGGANDGGYYLLGTKKIIPSLFKNKEWSTANVFENTIKDFENEELSFFTLPFLNDLDEEKDIPAEWL